MSCTESSGNQIVGRNLTVYYTDIDDEVIAEKLALYWRDRDLISSTKQDIRLVKNKNNYELQIIALDSKEIKNMPFLERKLLLDLQRNLEDSITKVPLEIVICDSQFKPIYNINK